MSDDLVIRLATVDDYPNIRELLYNNFYDDVPNLSANGNTFKLEERERHIQGLLNYEEKLIALKNDKIVGVTIGQGKTPEDFEKNAIRAEAVAAASAANGSFMGHVLRFNSKLERDADIFNRLNIDKVLHSQLTFVHRDLRGQGVGNRLVEGLAEIAREKGYKALTAHCISFYSARQKENLGWKCLHTQIYADYRDKDGKAPMAPEGQHDRVRVMVLQL